jgi:serine/threonine-protein kinase
LARLTHPNIVQVYDFLREANQAYIAMELVAGVELETYIRDKDDYKLDDALSIGAQLADALDYAHGRGVIHRDFKPANILMSSTGQPKITDFGLAKVVGTGFETLAGTIIGSPAYMSPEQALGKPLDERTDFYSFGVVLYWMTTGRLPFEGNAKEMMDSHINTPPLPPAAIDTSLPTSVNDVVMQLLAKDPSCRIENMDAVASILRDAS